MFLYLFVGIYKFVVFFVFLIEFLVQTSWHWQKLSDNCEKLSEITRKYLAVPETIWKSPYTWYPKTLDFKTLQLFILLKV